MKESEYQNHHMTNLLLSSLCNDNCDFYISKFNETIQEFCKTLQKMFFTYNQF